MARYDVLVVKQVLIDGKVFRDTEEVPGLFEVLEQDLLKSPELSSGMWKRDDVPIIENMILSVAGELSLSRSLEAKSGHPELPAAIQGRDVIMAALRYDTAPTRQCDTPVRIRSGQATLRDVFTYSGDFDKLTKLSPDPVERLNMLKMAETTIKMSEQLWDFEPARTSLLRGILGSKLLQIQMLLWNLKANLLISYDENHIRNEAEKVINAWGLRW